jgi:hypothetical protein
MPTLMAFSRCGLQITIHLQWIALDCIGLSLAVHGLKAGEFFNDDQRLGMARFQGPRKSISISKQIAFQAQSKFNLLMNFLRRTSKTLHPDAARW